LSDGPTMYALLGVTGHTNFLLNALYSIVGPVTNLFFITVLIDRIGRKKPLYLHSKQTNFRVFGAIGLGVVLTIECAMNAVYQPSDATNAQTNKAGQIVGILMIWLASIIFSLSFGPVSWVYQSEIFPMRIRARGAALSTMAYIP
jgi:MFS family permease